jgi:hypothetical protein
MYPDKPSLPTTLKYILLTLLQNPAFIQLSFFYICELCQLRILLRFPSHFLDYHPILIFFLALLFLCHFSPPCFLVCFSLSPFQQLYSFSKRYSDHLFFINYAANGWANPEILADIQGHSCFSDFRPNN